jgi:hypothetical protein
MYDFRNISITRKVAILVDGQPYDPKKNYTQVENLELSSDTTDIQLNGLIRLTYINLSECIKLEPFSVRFSEHFMSINDRQFHGIMLIITFKNISAFKRLNEFLITYQGKKDYNQVDDTLTIYLDRVTNFNMMDYVDISHDFGFINKGGQFSISDTDSVVYKKVKRDEGDIEIKSERDQDEKVRLSESDVQKREKSKLD